MLRRTVSSAAFVAVPTRLAFAGVTRRVDSAIPVAVSRKRKPGLLSAPLASKIERNALVYLVTIFRTLKRSRRCRQMADEQRRNN
ncbi:hypothetical protein ACEVHA_028060, partial [Klebsiella pneumoniae]